MKYSIHVNEGWIGYYNRMNKQYAVTMNSRERIRCPYELASAIICQLRERGVKATLKAEFVMEKNKHL